MTCQKAAIPMTFSDVQGHSPIASLFKKGVALTGRNRTGPPCNVTVDL